MPSSLHTPLKVPCVCDEFYQHKPLNVDCRNNYCISMHLLYAVLLQAVFDIIALTYRLSCMQTTGSHNARGHWIVIGPSVQGS